MAAGEKLRDHVFFWGVDEACGVRHREAPLADLVLSRNMPPAFGAISALFRFLCTLSDNSVFPDSTRGSSNSDPFSPPRHPHLLSAVVYGAPRNHV